MRKSIKQGILYPAILLLIILTFLVTNMFKSGAGITSRNDFQDNIFLLDTPTGLSSQTTYSILKDKDGFIWVATRNGIDRYDGLTFQHYKLGDTRMRALRDGMSYTLYCDNDGDIWAFTERSVIHRYDKDQDRFVEEVSLPKLKIWGSVQALYRHEHSLVIGATDGITWYDMKTKKAVKRFCPDDNIRSLIRFQGNKLLFGSQRGVGTIDLETKQGRLTSWIETSVNTLYYDQAHSRIWVGGNGTGIHIFDPEFPYRIQTVAGTEGWVISQFCPYADQMLVGVDGAGLWKAELDDEAYVKQFELLASDTPEAPHQIESSSVRSVMADGENIWIAMYIGGITHMQPPTQLQQLQNADAQSPSDRYAQGVSTDAEGNIWVAFEQAIARFSADGSESQLFLDHRAHFLTVLPASDGTVWCGGYNAGLYHFDPRTGWQEHFASIVGQPVKDCVYSIKQDHNGDIWVGGLNFPLTRMHRTESGEFEYKSYEGVTLVTDVEWLTPDTLVASTTGGLYIIDTHTDQIDYRLHEEEEWQGTNFVSNVATRNGHEIWAVTQGAGLLCYDIDQKKKPITAFDLDDGLPSLELRSMEWLNDDILCISTESNGLFAFDCAKHKYLNSLRHSDGIGNTLFLQASSGHNSQEQVIFGGNQGAVVINASDILTEKRNFDIFAVGKGLTDNIVELPYNARNLDIQFTTNDIYHQNEYNFFYRLAGITDDWLPIDNSRHVRFAQLPAGEYRLDIRTSGTTDQTTSLSINIIAEQEPWLRWYSILAYILVIVLSTVIVMNTMAEIRR